MLMFNIFQQLSYAKLSILEEKRRLEYFHYRSKHGQRVISLFACVAIHVVNTLTEV